MSEWLCLLCKWTGLESELKNKCLGHPIYADHCPSCNGKEVFENNSNLPAAIEIEKELSRILVSMGKEV